MGPLCVALLMLVLCSAPPDTLFPMPVRDMNDVARKDVACKDVLLAVAVKLPRDCSPTVSIAEAF